MVSFSFGYESRLIIEVKSDHIGAPGLIGLTCESGEFSGCEPPKSNDPIPIGCEGVLMFAPDSQTCGCNSKRSKRSNLEDNSPSRSTFRGWTPYYANDDQPSGTGDHENYFYFRGGEKDWSYRGGEAAISTVYGIDGQAYNNCTSKGIYARTRETHVKDFRKAMNRDKHRLKF